MNLVRIGEKVLSPEKLEKEIRKIIQFRVQGLTQGEVARKLGIERTFISRLESLGEIRKGKKIALVGFPIKNKQEIITLSHKIGIDYTLILTQKERYTFMEKRTKTDLFNEIISIMSQLVDFDLILFLGSDKRVSIAEKLFSIQVIGIEMGKSPLKSDQYVNPDSIIKILKQVKVT